MQPERNSDRSARKRRIIRTPEVDRRCGTTQYLRSKWIRAGKFPQPIILRPASDRCPPLFGFYEDEIDRWIEDRPRASSRRNEASPAAATA